eukprot:CAMPEP_0184416030 /NCGR_PEP_ID=MMETSP0738-20130409/9188_1 /TAXON_ID=385413 /ORGANISM="Thalassiosira miniscula, Strain CCMP1093" /LENGTH=143 /DNA_ID=CAMNT_0026775387 /DNA_START=344 /DNA_END=776 /DNA_ORIENTATION=+
MTDLMDIGGETIAIDGGAIRHQPVGRHVYKGACGGGANCRIAGIGTAVIVVKGDLRPACDLHEVNIGHHFPGFKRPAGQLLSRRRQLSDIYRDLVAAGGIKTVAASPSASQNPLVKKVAISSSVPTDAGTGIGGGVVSEIVSS